MRKTLNNQKQQKHDFYFQTLIFFLIIILLSGTSLATMPLVVSSPPDQDQDTNPIIAVFEPFRQVAISSEIMSRIKRIHKGLGQRVKAGDLLITLESELFIISLQKNQTLLELAQEKHRSNTELFAEKTISLSELNESKTELALAKLNLAIAKRDLSACTLQAPYSGLIKKIVANEYEWSEQGKTLLEIVDDSTLYAKVLIPLASLSKIHIGDRATIKVNIVNKMVKGKISHISPVVDSASQTSEILIEVDNYKGHLKSGMIGVVSLPYTPTP